MGACSEVEVPACPACCQQQLVVVVSRAQECPYETVCHGCKRRNMERSQGYFYRCPTCGLNLCGWPDEEQESWEEDTECDRGEPSRKKQCISGSDVPADEVR